MQSPQVVQEAECHIRAIQCAKDIVDAAYQSASQYKSTREAIRKARIEENKAREREELKRQKEAEASAKREAAAAEKKRKQDEKKRKKDAEKKAAEDNKECDKEGDDGEGEPSKKRRRGRGGDELGPDDYPVLCNRFVGHDCIKVVDTLETFVGGCCSALPSIWRARRAPFKKVMDADDNYTQKTSMAASTTIAAAVKAFTEEFAQVLETDPQKIKKTEKCPEEVLKHMEALSLEQQAIGVLEAEAENPTLYLDELCMVIDRETMQEHIQRVVDSMSAPDHFGNAAAEPLVHKAKNEQLLYNHSQFVGFAKGKSFSGVMTGLYPHLIYQLDGTRVIALVDIRHVAWLCGLWSCFIYINIYITILLVLCTLYYALIILLLLMELGSGSPIVGTM